MRGSFAPATYCLAFQPFLRFYKALLHSVALRGDTAMFQPFLRFYAEEIEMVPLTESDVFQPFLRFYGMAVAATTAHNTRLVSTLLEILPPSCMS